MPPPPSQLANLRRDFAAWIARADRSDDSSADWEHAALDFLRASAEIKAGAAPLNTTAPPRPALSLSPARSARLIILIRHAEAGHNAGDAVAVDPWLTAAGRRAAAGLGKQFGSVDAVIASPLARALQTASLAFGERDGLLTRKGAGDKNGAPLMAARGARGAVRPRPGVSYIIHPDLIETNLGLPSDRVAPDAEAAFPGWQRVEPTAAPTTPTPEPAATVAARGARFLVWLATRSEPRVAIVSHGGLLASLLAPHGHDHGPLSAPAFRTPFALCEARAFVVADWNGATSVREWW